MGVPGGVLIAYSISGKSPNILAAIAAARLRKMIVIGLTGQSTSPMSQELCDHVICTPSTQTPQIQEGHLIVGHVLCQLIESELFPEYRKA